MPKISVIVPVYNTAKYLDRCLISLVNQTIDDLEIILIDDASTDGSLDILKAYQRKYSNKIKLEQLNENSGVSVARNKGLEIATGAYIGFVDSDDFISPIMYEKLLEGIETTGADIARTNHIRQLFGIDLAIFKRNAGGIKDKIINPSTHPSYISTESVGVTNKLFKRDIIGNRKFVPGLKWEDYPFTVPLLVSANRIASTEESLYTYNMHVSNTTFTDARELSGGVLDIFTCSDMIGKECFSQDISDNVRRQLEYLQIQHCIIRLAEVASAKIPLQEKRTLLTLLSELIKVKYGSWQDHENYLKQKEKNMVYGIRMGFVEKLLLPPEKFPQDEEELKERIKSKLKILAK